MFKEAMSIIEKTFINYFFDQKLFILFIIAMLVIFAEEKTKDNKNYLVYYSGIILLLFFNPIFYIAFSKIITENTYYRVLWLVPLGIVIAYFATIMISKIDKKVYKAIFAIFFIGIIIYSGKIVYSGKTFQKVDNPYKLSDEILQIVDVINENTEENKKAMISTDLVGYIRQVDASIKLAYGRRPYGNYEYYFPIIKYYDSGDVKTLIDLCKEQDVNIIVYDNSISLTISPSYFGYELCGQTEHYDIYVLK